MNKQLTISGTKEDVISIIDRLSKTHRGVTVQDYLDSRGMDREVLV